MGTLFSFDSTYAQQEELEFGRGYWLRITSSGDVLFTGVVIDVWIVEVNEGWNLIGGISQSVYIDELISENELIIPGTIYEFTGSYENAEFLFPGRGYWIRMIQGGFITLSSQN